MAALRNLAVGYFDNAPFCDAVLPYVERIREVFFAWPGVLSCRPAPADTPERRERMRADLLRCRREGLLLDTLFNCNCYGDDAVSDNLADFVSSVLKEMDGYGLFPDIVTTTSPFIATVLRARFPSAQIRFSVNMRVHGTTGLEPAAELFDSFYASREHHREPDKLAAASAWARAHGKEIGIQANSGCLRQCPFQQFHDNLHGHDRVRQSGVGEKFGFSVFRCRTHYARGHYEDLIRATWIRPEDVPFYEKYVDVVKLATRRHPHPAEIVKAYATYAYDGNLLDLLDPVHADLFPRAIDNKAFPADFASTVAACPHANDCRRCGRCADILARVMHEPAAASAEPERFYSHEQEPS